MENLNNTLENNQTGQEVIPTQEINETPAQAISIQEKQNNILAGIKSDRLKALAQRAYDRVNAQNELVEEQPKEETKQTEQEKPQEEQPEMLEGRGKFWNKVASAGLDVAKGTLIETPARALPNAVTSAISETADLVYQIGGLELKAIDKVLGTKLSKDKDIYFPEIPEWKIKDDPWVNTVLIYIYTGFRLQELLGMKTEQINIKDWYFEGGIKTAAGKCRIVPIHDRIKPFVKALVDEGNKYLFTYQGKKFSQANYYKCWGEVMEKIGADKTPHEARHTFETNLDNAKGNRKCIDMLMGHKSKDVGNRVYNHKTIEQLRETVALLK